MKKFSIETAISSHKIQGDDVTIARGHLRIHRNGEIVFDELAGIITSLDSIEMTDEVISEASSSEKMQMHSEGCVWGGLNHSGKCDTYDDVVMGVVSTDDKPDVVNSEEVANG
jgi:hypothetical protein